MEENALDTYKEIKQGEKGAWLSIGAYIFLSALKLFVGAMAGSQALFADGLNNSTDIAASVAVLVGLKISQRPPDRNHRYGHFRAETVAALIASFIMFAVGLQVLIQTFQKMFDPVLEKPDLIAAWTALFSGMVMLLVYRYNIKLAIKVKSNALKAAAADNRSDALVSVGAFVGIVGSQFGLPWLDPLTAFVVGLIICKTAWDIFRETSHALTDGFDETKLEKLKKTIEKTPGVEALKDVKARVHGSSILVDATIEVDHQMNVAESHEITENIEERLLREHRITHVHIHIEPVEKGTEES